MRPRREDFLFYVANLGATMRKLSLYDLSNVYGGATPGSDDVELQRTLFLSMAAHAAGYAIGQTLGGQLNFGDAAKSTKDGLIVPLAGDSALRYVDAGIDITRLRQAAVITLAGLYGLADGWDNAHSHTLEVRW